MWILVIILVCLNGDFRYHLPWLQVGYKCNSPSPLRYWGSLFTVWWWWQCRSFFSTQPARYIIIDAETIHMLVSEPHLSGLRQSKEWVTGYNRIKRRFGEAKRRWFTHTYRYINGLKCLKYWRWMIHGATPGGSRYDKTLLQAAIQLDGLSFLLYYNVSKRAFGLSKYSTFPYPPVLCLQTTAVLLQLGRYPTYPEFKALWVSTQAPLVPDSITFRHVTSESWHHGYRRESLNTCNLGWAVGGRRLVPIATIHWMLLFLHLWTIRLQ